MENYDNNTYTEDDTVSSEQDAPIEETAEISEVEVIESDASEHLEADGESADDSAEEAAPAEDEPAEDDSEDITSVAEGLASIRNPFVVPDETVGGSSSSLAGDDSSEGTALPTRDECGLFKGFNLHKALVTAACVLVTVSVLATTMGAAIAATGDKTRRESDYDLIDESEAEEAARAEASKKAPLETAEDIAQFRVTLDFFDRDDIELYSTKMTLGEIIEQAGVELLPGEEPKVALDTMIGSEYTVEFDKFEITTDVITESVPYESVVYETDLIPRGTTNYTQYGKEGVSQKTYSVKLKNGEEISRELVGEVVAEPPVSEIYELGVGGSFVGGDGASYTYSYRRIVKATYYYIPNDPSTYIGTPAGHQTLAVDMNVIPLGTWLYVKNDKYDFGLRQAQDIGGAVKGDMIDIWLDGSEPGYQSFANIGLHYDMEVYYVD